MSRKVVARLWLRMAEIFGHRWTSTFGETPDSGAGLTWSQALKGMSAAQLRRGVAAAALGPNAWPPTLPEFRALCLGVPSYASVAVDLRAARELPFTRLVWSLLDAYTYRRVDVGQASRMLREAYDAAVEHVFRGGEIPPAPAGELPEQPKPLTPAPREVAEAEIQAMQRILGDADAEVDDATGEDDLEGDPCTP